MVGRSVMRSQDKAGRTGREKGFGGVRAVEVRRKREQPTKKGAKE